MIRKYETIRDYNGINKSAIQYQIKNDAATLIEYITGARCEYLKNISKKDAAFIAASLNNILKTIEE